ncbi:MAG: hypothetical protein HOV71_00855, partial [Hamadaea sp.]|nr:hypothetical protein [Hamadaea sp.]
VALRVGGWPVTGDHHTSVAVNLGGFEVSGTHQARDATPLGGLTSTPWLSAYQMDGWKLAGLALNGGEQAPRAGISGPVVTVTWPDLTRTTAPLDFPLPRKDPS